MININKKKLKVLILIPSRLESIRLPRKPLRNILGKPMIVRVANRAKDMKIGEVIVASSNKGICKVLKNNAINYFLTSKNHKSGTDRIFEAFEKSSNEDIDVILNIQGDLPYFRNELVFSTIDLMKDRTVDIGSAICDLQEEEILDNNIVKANVELDKRNQGVAMDFVREIKDKKNYYHHIGIYAFRPKSIEKFINLKQTRLEKERGLEQMRALENGMKIKLVKVKENPPSVDTLFDLKKIRLFFRENNV